MFYNMSILKMEIILIIYFSIVLLNLLLNLPLFLVNIVFEEPDKNNNNKWGKIIIIELFDDV